jgi:hypothetical protein
VKGTKGLHKPPSPTIKPVGEVLPVAPPPTPVDMADVQSAEPVPMQVGEDPGEPPRSSHGQEIWDVTFLATCGLVRLEKRKE